MAVRLKGQLVNLALVVLALGLVVAVVVTRGRVTTSEKDARATSLLGAYREDDITRVTVEKAGQRLVLARVPSGDAGDTTFDIVEPLREEADAYAVDKFLGSLEFARYVRKIRSDEVDRAAFGLDAATLRLALEMGKVQYELRFGKEAATPPGARYLELVARGGPDSGVFIVSKELVTELDVDAGTLRGRQMLPYTSNELERVLITGTDGVVRKLKSAGHGRWRFEGMEHDARVDREAFDQVLTQFARTKAEHFLDVEEAGRALGDKFVRLELEPKQAGRARARIEVGGRCPKSENDVVAIRRAPDPAAACVPSSVVPGLDTPVTALVDTGLFSLRKDEVESLRIVRGGKKLDLERKESGFVLRAPVSGDVELEIGNRRVEAVVRARGELAPEANAKELGLEPPTGTVSVRSSGESDEKVVEEVLEIGKPSQGGKLPVRRKSDGLVLWVDADGARNLEADSTLVRSLRIFEFTPADLRSLEVQGQDLHEKVRREAAGQLLFDLPKGHELDAALVANAVDELAGLKADRWVSESDDGSFGLSKPALSVKLAFSAGDAGTRERTLLLGAATTGGAYGKLDGEDGVFVVSRRVVDAVSTWFVDRSVFALTPDVADRVELERGGKKLVLEKRGERFVRSSGVALSDTRIAEISDTLVALRAEAAIDLGGAKPNQGFAKPELIVRAASGDAAEKSFRVGAGDAWRGESVHYARADGVDATYVIAKSKVRVLLDAF